MIAVAVLVCMFAIGMAALLNYFKYKSTAEGLVQSRITVTGRSIEHSIQASLSLGLSFSELASLSGQLERERAADDLILGIDVFDTAGRPLYSTDRLRMGRQVPESWLAAAKRAGQSDWSVDSGDDTAVGISIKNNFGLTEGYLVMRYSREKVDRAAFAVARQLALSAAGIFAVAALFASIALTVIMRRFERDMNAVEAALQRSGNVPAEAFNKGPFGPALVRFLEMARVAEAQIAAMRGKLGIGTRR